MDVSIDDFADDDFEEIMKDLDVVDSWINDDEEGEETLDVKSTLSAEPSKSIQEGKKSRNTDLISKDVSSEEDNVKMKKSTEKKVSSLEPISNVKESGPGSLKKSLDDRKKEKSTSATREGKEKISRDTRHYKKAVHHDRDRIFDTRDGRHGNGDGRLHYKEGHGDHKARYHNTERHKSDRPVDRLHSKELLLSPGREIGRRRLERSPNYYENNNINRRDICKTLRDIKKDKEEKESHRHLHDNSVPRLSQSQSQINPFLINTLIENDFVHAHSTSFAPPIISPGPSLRHIPNNTENFYEPHYMGAPGNVPMYHNDQAFPPMYNSNMGNPVMIPTGGYDPRMESMPPMSYECYPAPYLAEPMQVMPPMYSASVAAPPSAPEGIFPPKKQPPPDSQEALDQLLAEKSISLEDYLKLTTRPKAATAELVKPPRSKSVEIRNELIDRCQEAVSKLTKLQLPNRLIVSHSVHEPVRQSDLKYCSPLKRHPAVRYNFTTPAKDASQKNKQLLSSVLTTIGLEKMLLFNKKLTKHKKNSKDAAVQTVEPLCDKCEVRKSIETCSKETSIDRLYLTKSAHTQVIEKELANSESMFTPNFDGPTVSLSHMTPAQILASKLSTKAKNLQSQQMANLYNAEMSSGFTRRQPFNQYEQRDMYDARRTQDELFEQRVSHNDAMYDQRRHHNQMQSQNKQLFEKRVTPDEKRYNPY